MKRLTFWLAQCLLITFAAAGLVLASPLQKDDGCSGPGCPYEPCPSGEVAHCTNHCENKIDGIHCTTSCYCQSK
jgi:hypothetical protein